MSKTEWISVKEKLPPEHIPVETKIDDEKNAELERVTTIPTDSELSIEIKDKKSIKKLKKLMKLKWYEKLIIILCLQYLKKVVKSTKGKNK